MATNNIGEGEDVGAYNDGDVFGKALSDYEAQDTCEISVKKGKYVFCVCQ